MAIFAGPTNKEIRWRKITTALLITANIVLLFPAVFYWVSFIMRQGLGTDYWYDLVFESWTKNGWRSLVLVLFVILFPAEEAVINFLVYRKKKLDLAKWSQIAGVILMIAGVYAALKKW